MKETKKPFRHPELRPGEVFVGNCDSLATRAIKERWRTVRFGNVAYNTKTGEPIRSHRQPDAPPIHIMGVGATDGCSMEVSGVTIPYFVQQDEYDRVQRP